MADNTQGQIAALQAQLNALTGKEAADVAGLQIQINTLQTALAALLPPTRIPAAVAGRGWAKKAEWNFGTNPGNNVAKLSDFLNSGWASDNGQWGCETAVLISSDTDPHFQVQPDYADLVDILAGANTSPKQGDGTVTAPVLVTHVDQWGMTGPGYYEGTFRIPSVNAMWPAWWMIGWDPASKAPTWGPEIDTMEVFGQSDMGPTQVYTTLHTASSPSQCFLPAPGAATVPVSISSAVNGVSPTNWAAGGLKYAPGIDFSQVFHTYGTRINSDFSIDTFIDDMLIGSFAAKQFCTDSGMPVVPRLIIDFAVQNGNPIVLADFSGANKWRLSVKNIQLWG